MSKYIKPGEFVDGKKCAVVTRKYDFKGPHRDPLTNSIMMLYELSRNCSVEVTQKHDDDIERITGVHYIVGDIIEAESIQMWVDTKRDNVGFVVKEGVTATHGANLADTKKRTIGTIKYPRSVFDKLLGFTAKPKLKSK